jgi:hypothetical protein
VKDPLSRWTADALRNRRIPAGVRHQLIKDGRFRSRLMRRASGGGGEWTPARADVFVDSVNGSDSNPGTFAAPVQSLSAASAMLSAGKTMAIFRGSRFTATTGTDLFVVPYSGFKLGVVGTGDPPVFDGRKPVVGGWVRADPGTYPNVWSQTVEPPGPASGAENTGLWVDGTRPTYRTSIAALSAAGEGWHSSSRTSLSQTISVYSTVDPGTDGKEYLFTWINRGIQGHSSAVGERVAELYGPIETIGFRASYSGLSGGLGLQSGFWLRDGNIHHSVTEGDQTDCLFSDWDLSLNQTPHTLYRDEGAGLSRTHTRIVITGPTSISVNGTYTTGLFGHNGVSEWDAVTCDQCVLKGVGAGYSFTTSASNTFSNSAVLDSKNAALVSGGETFTARRLLFSSTTTGGERLAFDAAGPNPASRNFTAEDCVVYVAGGSATGALRGGPGGTYTFRRCILYFDTAFTDVLNLPEGGNLVIEDCIIVSVQVGTKFVQGVGSYGFTGSNNLYVGDATWARTSPGGSWGTLADWQAFTGEDAGSAWAATTAGLFAGDIAAGDFRLASTGLGATATAMGVGPADHWDFQARAITAGPPVAWPVPPATTAERRTYISDPAAWEWYP